MGSKIEGKILEHAIKCFAAKGYHGTTTKEIAVAANVTESSVFRLFYSKDGLFEEVIKSAVSSQVQPDEFEALLNRKGEFREVVFSAVRRWYRALGDDYVRLAMFANLYNPKLAQKEIYGRVMQRGKGLADAADRHRGRRCGSRESFDLATNFMFGLFYYKLTRPSIKDSSPEADYLRHAVDAWLDAVESRVSQVPRSRS